MHQNPNHRKAQPPVKLEQHKKWGGVAVARDRANWNAARQWADYFEDRQNKEANTKWLFRGQSDDKEPETSLGRLRRRFEVEPSKMPDVEAGLLREFQRVYHLHGVDAPDRRNMLAWLTLMQHHGAPTRLLDFTYSFWVALFFAVEHASEDSQPVVWAIDMNWCIKSCPRPRNWPGNKHIQEDRYWEKPKPFDDFFRRKRPLKLVHPANTYFLNRRLAVQQGCFLCPGSVKHTFMENFKGQLDRNIRSESSKVILIRLDSAVAERKAFISGLHHMNVNRATLFPGLDGLAGSFQTRPDFGRYANG